MVTLRSGYGELGILPRHAPLASTVKQGIIKVKLPEGGEDYIYTNGGFLEILPDKITILADTAEIGGFIDVERAARAKERAEARLNKRTEDIDVVRAELALQRALKRLEAAELSKRGGNLLGPRD
jgi:F-type H+-transporting ATPase subunit epsilon